MARIESPRFMTPRKRKSGAIYWMWQPPSRSGFKAVPLAGHDGAPADTATAFAQGQWMNAIYDQAIAGNHGVASMILSTWQARQSGKPLNLPEPPPIIVYDWKGLTVQDAIIPHAAKSLGALAASYQKSHYFLDCARRTRQDYASIITALVDLLGADAVTSLRRRRLQTLYDALLRKHGTHSANYRMRVLSVMLQYAVELEWLEANPLSRFPLRATQGRIRVATQEEMQALYRAAMLHMPEGPRPDVATLIFAAVDTGQRRSDLLENLSIEQFRDGRMRFEQNKTGQFINIPVLDQFMTAGNVLLHVMEARLGDLHKAFKRLRVQRPNAWFRHITETPLIWNMDRNMPMDKTMASRLFRRVRAVAMRECPSLSTLKLMDMRDTLITELFRASCTDAEVASYSGHSETSIAMKRKHYVQRHDPYITQNATDKLLAWRNRKERA